MTDPQQVYDQQVVTPSDVTSDRELASPAISISSAQHGGQSEPTSQATPHQLGTGAATAYTTNPHSGAGFDTLNFHPGQATHVPPAPTALYTTRTPNELGSSSHQTQSLGNFGWVPPSPYLSFAPQLVYEPTGELIDEHIQTFDQFDSPPSRQPSEILTAQRALQPTGSTGRPFSTNPPTSKAIIAPPPPLRSALKRKADSDANSPSHSEGGRKKQSSETGSAAARTVSFSRMSDSEGDGLASADAVAEDSSSRSGTVRSAKPGSQQPIDQGSQNRGSMKSPAATPRPATRGTGILYKQKPSAPSILPPEKVFPIQIGSELFRLSGASISSDGLYIPPSDLVILQAKNPRAPSYFTQFFEDQVRQNEESGGVRTLYIDRDPVTFRDVARHLQGYHVKPTDGSHFVKLFADAQFYSLPRLIDQLFESEIFIQIGDRHFQIPKDIFSGPGDSPNFFSLGFAVFFSTPGEVFPGLDRKGLLRPPSIVPPCVPGRSSEVFAQLLHMLKGYPLHIRDQEHRAELLRDCRYFHLRGLEQKLIAHEISYNLERQRSEICLRLEDVKPSGVSFVSDVRHSEAPASGGWVNYARPFVDDTSYEMILEISGESMVVDLKDMRADFHGLTKARVSSLFQVVANKMNLPTNAPLGLMMLSGGQSAQPASPGHTPLSEDRVKIRIERTADILLDGEPYEVDWSGLHSRTQAPMALETNIDAEAMSETPSAHGLSRTSSFGGMQQQRPQRQGSVSSDSAAVQTQSHLSVPPMQAARLPSGAPLNKKRKRQDSTDSLGDWVIRRGQWRLRVQPNPQDMLRGGYEIVFVAVKLDAYSEERARNARRSFLS